MAKKRLTKDPSCPRCGHSQETVNHVLFQCSFTRLVWTISPIGYLIGLTPADSLYTNLASCLFPEKRNFHDPIKSDHMWPWLLWGLWKVQNKLCFTSTEASAKRIKEKAEEEAQEWNHANEEDQCSISRRPSHRSPQVPRQG